MASKTIQGYVEDGFRNFELKIFKADIYTTSGPPIRHYFVSRLELGYTKVKGNASSYDKQEALMPILLSTSKKQCQAAYDKVIESGVIDSIDQIITEVEEVK